MCTTTPFPMTPMVPGCSIPDGRRWNLNVLSPTTMVCPAFEPPATRAQMLYFADRMSTFFFVRVCFGVASFGRKRSGGGGGGGGDE